MSIKDQDKIGFIINEGVRYYKVMPFGLLNTGVTYQQMMNMVFKDQVKWNLEVCIDDMLIKSTDLDGHLEDLEEIFKVMKGEQYENKSSMCAFGVIIGKL